MEVASMCRTVFLLACFVFVAAARADEPPAKVKKGWRDPLVYVDAGTQAIDRVKHVEFAEMLTAVLKGSDMGPNDGWFRHGSQSRYGWEWIAKWHGVAPDKSIRR